MLNLLFRYGLTIIDDNLLPNHITTAYCVKKNNKKLLFTCKSFIDSNIKYSSIGAWHTFIIYFQVIQSDSYNLTIKAKVI